MVLHCHLWTLKFVNLISYKCQHCQRKRSGRASLYSRDSKELQVTNTMLKYNTTDSTCIYSFAKFRYNESQMSFVYLWFLGPTFTWGGVNWTQNLWDFASVFIWSISVFISYCIRRQPPIYYSDAGHPLSHRI